MSASLPASSRRPPPSLASFPVDSSACHGHLRRAMEKPSRPNNPGSPNPIGSPAIFFSLALGLTVAGFWPSFFAVLPTAKLPHLVHGWSATLWMLLPLLQAWLIHTRRRKAHRWIGWASLPLAA